MEGIKLGGSSTLSFDQKVIGSSYDEQDQACIQPRLNSGRSFMIVGSSAFDDKG